MYNKKKVMFFQVVFQLEKVFLNWIVFYDQFFVYKNYCYIRLLNVCIYMYIKLVFFNVSFVNIFCNLYVYLEKYGYIGCFKRFNVKKLIEFFVG